jgi:hypothetical protein
MIKMLNNDWINLTFILIFALLALNKILFQKRFSQLLLKLFGNKYFSFYQKDNPLVLSVFNLIYFPINLITISLLIFYTTKHYFSYIFDTYNFETFVTINLIVFIFFVVKSTIRFFINIILSITKKARYFSFYKISFRNFSATILFPFLLIHQYSAIDNNTTLIILLSVFISITAIQYIYSSYLIIAQKLYPIFYIILYLCTLEIIPAFIYVKVIFIMTKDNFLSF